MSGADQAARDRARRRGLVVRASQCRDPRCACRGLHFAVAGRGLRRNGLTLRELIALLDELPVVPPAERPAPTQLPGGERSATRAAGYRS